MRTSCFCLLCTPRLSIGSSEAIRHQAHCHAWCGVQGFTRWVEARVSRRRRRYGQVDSTRCVISHSSWSKFYSCLCTQTDWTYMALPTTAMFRMPFLGQIGLLRSALDSLRQGIPEVERILRKGEYRSATSVGSPLRVSQRKPVQC
jgi:hypothetical protein